MDSTATSQVRRRPFLNGERVNGYARIAALTTATFVAVGHTLSWRTGSDFVAFWAAGREVVAGTPWLAYDLPGMAQTQRDLGFSGAAPFLNPPPYLAAVTPFSWAPYPLALAAWLAFTLTAYAVAVRCVAPPRYYWPALAFPGVLVCAMAAQNGALTGALTIGAIGLLPRRRLTAGALVGCMVIKPHLAILWPFALAAAGEWRAFGAAAVTVAAVLVTTLLALGPETFAAFFGQQSFLATLTQEGSPLLGKLQSVMGLALKLGLPQVAVVGAQLVASIAAIGLVALAWRRASKSENLWRGAILCAAAPLATPYVLAYDLPLLVVPVLYLATTAAAQGFRRGERLLLLGVFLSPLVVYAFIGVLPLTPLVSAGLLAALFARRNALEGRSSNQATTPGSSTRV